MQPLEVVILAAGKGTRMGGEKPKALHQIAGVPMLRRVADTASTLKPDQIHVVVPPGQGDILAECLPAGCQLTIQPEPLGTAAALKCALPLVSKGADLLVLYGDMPLLRPESLVRLREARTSGAALVMLTAILDDPSRYGRVIRNNANKVAKVVEMLDANDQERAVKEINTGVYLASKADFACWLEQVGSDNHQSEFYLTDIVALAAGDRVEGVILSDPTESLGINDRLQWAKVEAEQQKRFAYQLLATGVGVSSPEHLFLRGNFADFVFGVDCHIDVGAVLTGPLRCGDRVQIGAYSVLKNCLIEDDVVVAPFSHIEGCSINAGSRIGPFARLRPGSKVGANVEVGNFVEVNRSSLGDSTRAKHLAYLGDVHMGADCNIGAGVVTCNYDGNHKHSSELGEKIFVGSNSTLVSPLKVGDNAYVAAGSTVTRDIQPGQVAAARSRQRNIRGSLFKRIQKNRQD